MVIDGQAQRFAPEMIFAGVDDPHFARFFNPVEQIRVAGVDVLDPVVRSS